MNNEEKARLYDEYLRESDDLQRQNSRIKSEYVGNIPPNLEEQIKRNQQRISVLVAKLEGLFN